ncbi:MAG: lipid II flippase Amj family protein [Firmicutes bacterium]|nr:lipid II flippase Amj family protein [Bacillota bacterium]
MPFHLEQIVGDKTVMVVCLLNIAINLLTLTTNAARVSGAETGRVATALSLYNIFQVSFRLLNMVYAPLLGVMVDKLAKVGQVDAILIKLQYVVFSAAVGSLLGFLLLPTFIEIYKMGIKAMERHGSVPKVVVAFISKPHYWKALFSCTRRPSFLGVNPLDIKKIPRSFLFFNFLGVAIWTIGVIASAYASALNPDLVRTSLQLSGIVNGIGTICLFVLVEPVSALIVDQASMGKRPLEHVKIMVVWLALSSFIGNLFGLLLLVPSAHYILWMSKIVEKFSGAGM